MFMKNDFANKKIWASYSKSSSAENYGSDWELFSSREGESQQQNSSSDNSYGEVVFQETPQTPKPSVKSTELSMYGLARESRLRAWLSALPEVGFEVPRQQSPIRVRNLSDPVWGTMDEKRITASDSSTWNADFSSLKQMYGVASGSVSSSSDSSEKSSKNSNEKILCNSEKFEEINSVNSIIEIIDNDSMPSTSSSSTLCNAIQPLDSSAPLYKKNIDLEDSSLHTANSCLNYKENNCQNSNSHVDSSFLMKPNSLLKSTNKASNSEINLEHISHVLPVTYVKDFSSKDCLMKSELSNEIHSEVSNPNVMAKFSKASSAKQQVDSNVKLWTEERSKNFAPHISTSPVGGGTMNFRAQPFVPLQQSSAQHSMSTTPVVLPAVNPWHLACVNAAYANFLTWQWTTVMRSLIDQSTLIGQTMPLASYLSLPNLVLQLPNLLATIPPFYDNMTLIRLLQQKIFIQKQQILAASRLLIQQQQQQHQQHQQQQQQHQTNQRRQNYMQNARFRRPTQYSHNNNNNNNNNKNKSKNNNSNNNNSKNNKNYNYKKFNNQNRNQLQNQNQNQK